MPDTIIRVENLGKKYLIQHQQHASYTALRDVITDKVKSFGKRVISWNHKQSSTYSTTEEFWALKDISFNVKQGEIIGIIGRNGAGKTTLLKILSRITEPTTGRYHLKGRVASLLEVGTGFHPELTGRENIFLNGAILGMTRQEIKKKFDEIVTFAETEQFLDTPVKRYSSGMYVRLAFAVAAHLEPEILLVDEVLAVGDLAFQKKCLGKMGGMSKEGRTVLFVSHNMAAVTALCSCTYVLSGGHLVSMGQPQLVVDGYMKEVTASADVCLSQIVQREGDGRMKFIDIAFKDMTGNPINSAVSGKNVIISFGYVTRDNKPLRNVSIILGFHSLLGQFLFMCGNEMTGLHFDVIPSKGRINCHIPNLPLSPGTYGFNFHCSVNGIMADWVKEYIQLPVIEGDFFGTGYLPPQTHRGLLVNHTWSIDSSPAV